MARTNVESSDSPRSRLAWLEDLEGLPPLLVATGLLVGKRASLTRPFPLDNAELAAAIGCASSTVKSSLAGLIRSGRLVRVRQAASDGPVFGRWTANGQSVRWVPRPALYRLTAEWVGRRRIGTP